MCLLRREPGCGIVMRPRLSIRFRMQVLSRNFRDLFRAGSLVSICLLWASVASAAPAPRSHAKSVCDPAAARRLLRVPRSFGGPLKQPKQLLTLDELTSHL